MRAIISKPTHPISAKPQLVASKSIANRVLIIQYLCKGNFEILNQSKSGDTVILHNALNNFKEKEIIDVGAAGTAMRFMTAFLALKAKKEIILTGTERMQQRPIKILVDALKELGANIEYDAAEGYPPLKIKPSQIHGGKIKLQANISSQYISALLLIAPVLPGGLEIIFDGIPVSLSYIKMTLSIMQEFGIKYKFENNSVHISEQNYKPKNFTIENDWSAAAYWYLIAALSPNAKAEIPLLYRHSVQGDAAISELFEQFGVSSTFKGDTLFIENHNTVAKNFEYDFRDIPDQAQTFACLSAAKNINAKLSGLETLRIKETDRVNALLNELKKFGVEISNEENTLFLKKSPLQKPITAIETYDDHRMAMSFAPLSIVCKELEIEGAEVIKKSYPEYWQDLQEAGFKIKFV